MSYDVTLFVPSGSAPLEEQVHDETPAALTDEDRARLAALRATLLAYDPAAKLGELDDGAFVVDDGEKLPYLEVGARRAGLHMSMGSDSHAVYRALHETIALFAQHGFVAFDYQVGAIVKPVADFRAFMAQFRSEFQSDAAFEQWLSSDRDAPTVLAPAAPAKKPVPVLGIAMGVLLLIWALYKLHKAGYF
jgi:hypothetical protein